jgi:hypothetical protein
MAARNGTGTAAYNKQNVCCESMDEIAAIPVPFLAAIRC